MTTSTISACASSASRSVIATSWRRCPALYVVYGRGGDAFDPFGQGAQTQLRDAFSLRDDEQLLVKLSYRFEL